MATKHVFLKQVQGTTFTAKGDSNHWVMMDGAEEFGGSNAGARPKELVLFALAGCTASDVVNILKKKRVNLTGYEMNLVGKEEEDYPRAFIGIHIEYVFYGDNLRAEDLEHAIELSISKYCSVSAMLMPSVKITHSYKIEPGPCLAKSGETEIRLK